jgi:transcriptional regulator with XRE-family HTH domain
MAIPELKTVQLGKKIKRIRELKGIKQEALASKLGISQQTISLLEQSDEIDEERLAQVAKALDVSVEAIKNFNEDAAINNFNYNTFNDSSSLNSGNENNLCTFNPIEKLIDVMEENKQLYERLLKEKDGVIEMYKKLQKAS